MRRLWGAAAGIATLLSLTGVLIAAGCAPATNAQPIAAPPAGGVRYLGQGARWTAADRQAFYATDQGSEIMPLAWARALAGPDGRPFLADRLARYGYLPRDDGGALPIGFTAATRGTVTYLGMTCAACHTRQIEVDGAAYRVDGGPALSDFQSFLADLDRAVGQILADDRGFAAFAQGVLGASPAADQQAALKAEVAAWYHRQHTLFARALPAKPWGVGRLDAVSMIFNRVSGLDIGAAPDWIIARNIQPADAPVRYPFIWDAPRQDRTQWPGFADNGDVILAIARNLGEVYGVFADFHPVADGSLLGYDYHSRNSASFEGLGRLEGLVRKIGAPTWPWPVDAGAAARGGALFDRTCGGCHGEQEGALRLFPITRTWKTPLVDVGTDTHEYDILARTADSGVLAGARYNLSSRLGAQDKQFNILAAAVIGSMADRFAHHGLPVDALVQPIRLGGLAVPPALARTTPQQEIAGAYHSDVAHAVAPGATHAYEARVLHGIWATAPYLHNGSVASLAELLTTPDRRRAMFAIGPRYDRATVGLAAVQPGPAVRRTTGCDDLRSGDSRCGHAYGTDLSAADKRDLLEFLKTL